MPDSITSEIEAIQILLVDDDGFSLRLLAKSLCDSGVSPEYEEPPGGRLRITIRHSILGRPVAIEFLDPTRYSQRELISYVIEYREQFALILWDLAWSNNDPIVKKELKSEKSKAEVRKYFKHAHDIPSIVALRHLSAMGEPGKCVIDKIVGFSFNVYSSCDEHGFIAADHSSQCNVLAYLLLEQIEIPGVLEKPATDPGKLGRGVAQALTAVREFCSPRTRYREGKFSLVGHDFRASLREQNYFKYPNSPQSVLIRGDSGTGKENVAFYLHKMSARKSGPFVPINCSAIPTDLIESLLFGHCKGAFAFADKDTVGFFAAAHGGTIFLDEIGELPFNCQSKLLRVLEERVIVRVGETTEHPVDVRVISATNAPLEQYLAEKRFREDLLYRLNGAEIQLLPLRSRKDDFRELVEHFRNLKMSMLPELPERQFSREAIEELKRFPWPGNVRELRDHVWDLMTTCESAIIDAEHVHENPPKSGVASNKGSPYLPSGPATTVVLNHNREQTYEKCKRAVAYLKEAEGITEAAKYARNWIRAMPKTISSYLRKKCESILEVESDEDVVALFLVGKPGAGRKKQQNVLAAIPARQSSPIEVNAPRDNQRAD